MKIVEAQPQQSKGEIIVRMFNVLLCSDSSKAAHVETESDLRRFRKYARSRGKAVRAQKQTSGGWLVWLI